MWLNTHPERDEVRGPQLPGDLIDRPTLAQRVGLAVAPAALALSLGVFVVAGLRGPDSAPEACLSAGSLLCALAWAWIRLWPRDRRAPCASTPTGGVELPRRAGFAAATALAAAGTTLISLGLGWEDAVTPNVEGQKPGEVLLLLAPVAGVLGAVLVQRLRRGANALRLDADGVVYVSMIPRTIRVEWELVVSARPHRPWRRVLVVRSPWGALLAAYTGNQAWHPRDIAALLTFYAEHPRHRGELADPRAVERRRDSLAASGDA